MMTQCSQQSAQFWHSWQCETTRREPPINRPTPGLDEPVDDHGSDKLWWGHYLGNKLQGNIHVALQNIDRIPNNKKGNMKLDYLCLFMIKQEIDIMAMKELNMAWDCLEYKDRLPAKTWGWWEANHWSVTHNKQDKHGDTFQLGGTAIVVLNALSHKTTKPGDDITGLGRWSWAHLRGKEDHFLWLVSLYRPCKSDRHLTTYQQHVRWFTKQGKDVCPKKQILDDLHEQVEQWQSTGDIVIILADINEDVAQNQSTLNSGKWVWLKPLLLFMATQAPILTTGEKPYWWNICTTTTR